MIEIKNADKENIKQIIQLSKQNLTYHNSLRDFYDHSDKTLNEYETYLNSIINNPNHILLIAKKSDTIIGYMISKITWKRPYEKIKKLAEIGDAFVDENYRRNKIGEKLLQETQKQLKDVDAIILLVDTKNTLGENAWKKYGFEDYQKKLIKFTTNKH